MADSFGIALDPNTPVEEPIVPVLRAEAERRRVTATFPPRVTRPNPRAGRPRKFVKTATLPQMARSILRVETALFRARTGPRREGVLGVRLPKEVSAAEADSLKQIASFWAAEFFTP